MNTISQNSIANNDADSNVANSSANSSVTNKQRDNLVNSSNSSNELTNVDEETLSRAILTFCLEGADALMYTLLLGSSHASDIVTALKTMVQHFTECKSDYLAQQMQLPITCESADPENINTTKTKYATKRDTNQELVDTMWHCISKHKEISTLEKYFNKGLTAWGYKNNDVNQSLELLHKTIAKWCVRLTHLPTWDRDELCNWFTDSGKQWIIAPHSKYWPKQLQDLAYHSHFAPPLCIWGIGNPNALTQCHNPLAIVGSRFCTDYGRELAYQFAYNCAEKGHTVISGGAYGIDAAAHWGAIAAATASEGNKPIGRTIAVFAGGLNHMGPRSNEQLFNQIIENDGACISELCPDTTPVGHRFLLRNRIIAALSSKVLVAQARLQSGALNTATWATDLNRELYAIPGDITHPHNAGCNKIIHDSQAIMVCSKQDIDILFPQSHHYLAYAQPNTVNEIIESQNYDNTQKLILKAITTCKRKRELANIDRIYEIIKDSYSKEQSDCIPSVAEISGKIAMLELEGIIIRNKENLTVSQKKVA